MSYLLAALWLALAAALFWRWRRNAWQHLVPDLAALLALAVLLLSILAPRPVPATTATTGPAIALAVDVSHSMGCASGAELRLDAAQRELRTLVTGLPQAEFALIPFAGAATVQVPLGNDREALLFFIDHLAPGMVDAPGSAPEEALLTARQALASTQRPKLVLLLSDGERTLPARPPELPNTIPVFTIALGGSTVMPVPDRGAAAFSTPDPERLRQIAMASGGTLLTTAGEPAVTPLLRRWAAPAEAGNERWQWLPAIVLGLLLLRQLQWPRPRAATAAALLLALLAGAACRREAPTPGETAFLHACHLYERGAKEEAFAAFAAAARLLDGPGRGAALYNQGTLLLAAGDAGKALPLLEEALLLRPDDEAVRCNFILALRAGGADKSAGVGEGAGANGERNEGEGLARSQALQLLESVRLEPGGTTTAAGRVSERRIEQDW